MDPEQARIHADLRGLIEGEVLCDPLYLQLYASDASIYEIQPVGVVRPKSTADVSKVLKYANQNAIAVFPRGGGSGLAGQSLGRGLVLDFSRFMRRIHAPHNKTIRVQCGVVQADLNRTLGQHNLLFGPDPATRSVSSIGSMLSIDATGSHFPRYGSAGQRLASVQAVLATGEVIELNRHRWALDEPPSTVVERLASEVGTLLQKNSGLLLRPPWSEVARGVGYRVEKTLDGDHVNLARLLCGSEGTLAIITEATLELDPIPEVRGLLLLFFERLDAAAKAVLEIAKEDISACDLMDRRLLEIARETEPAYESLVPRGAEAMLLVEIQGEDSAVIRSRLMALLQRLQRRNKPVMSYRLTTDNQERNILWRLARRVIPRLYRLKGTLRPLPFVEDISIPPKRLPDFLLEVQNVLKAERVTATLFAHAAHGQLDVRPFLDLANPHDHERLTRLSEALYNKVLEFGGCIAGEHALGLSRAALAERQLGPRLELCREIKRIFDPSDTLNPGKFLSLNPPQVNQNLRPIPRSATRDSSLSVGTSVIPLGNAIEAASAVLGTHSVDHKLLTIEPQSNGFDVALLGPELDLHADEAIAFKLPVILDWSGSETFPHAVRSCNGCGRCRTSAAAERMCPMFRVHKGEEAAPRAKANLLRGMLTGQLDPALLESQETKAIADLCFNCHQCRMECPASVNIPKLVQEIKAQHIAGQGLTVRERLLNRIDLIAAMGSRFPQLANWALSNPLARWFLEKSTGIAQGRKLPRVTRRTFLRWAAREKLARPNRASGRKVLYFVDQYVNWHNPLLGRAIVEVLRHQKVDVYCPIAQTPSFMAMIAAGDVARARKLVQPNIRLLADAVRQGYEIVTTEPSAALCLQHEYRNLMQDEDTELIAKHASEVCSYLWSMHLQNELELDFKPVTLSVVYHEPCHARVLDSNQPALNLLRLIPGLQLQFADHGCSGMAGTFGLQRKNYRTSLRIGRGLINTMKETSAQLGATECTACKMQMEQGTTKPTVHPIALLAYAYGTMPQLAGWFTSRTQGLIIS